MERGGEGMERCGTKGGERETCNNVIQSQQGGVVRSCVSVCACVYIWVSGVWMLCVCACVHSQ